VTAMPRPLPPLPAARRLLGRQWIVPPATATVLKPLSNPARLAVPRPSRHGPTMFIVSEEAAAAIRTAFDHGGELLAAIELRRLFPGIIDNAKARDCARTIAGWTPLPLSPVKARRLRPRKNQ
jgi:hypothetical protein